jgi:hypothetical protein
MERSLPPRANGLTAASTDLLAAPTLETVPEQV